MLNVNIKINLFLFNYKYHKISKVLFGSWLLIIVSHTKQQLRSGRPVYFFSSYWLYRTLYSLFFISLFYFYGFSHSSGKISRYLFVALLLSLFTELLQLTIPHRTFNPVDAVFNLTGFGIGIGIFLIRQKGMHGWIDERWSMNLGTMNDDWWAKDFKEKRKKKKDKIKHLR